VQPQGERAVVIDFDPAEGKQTLEILRCAWKQDIGEQIARGVKKFGDSTRAPRRHQESAESAPETDDK
jgi:hypothetical protein